MSARWTDDRLAEPYEWQEPSDNMPGWAHGLILVALLGLGFAVWVIVP